MHRNLYYQAHGNNVGSSYVNGVPFFCSFRRAGASLQRPATNGWVASESINSRSLSWWLEGGITIVYESSPHTGRIYVFASAHDPRAYSIFQLRAFAEGEFRKWNAICSLNSCFIYGILLYRYGEISMSR